MTDTTAPATLAGRNYVRLIVLAAAIGIPAALLAAMFLALVHELEDWLWYDLPDALDYAAPPWSSSSACRSSAR